MSKFLLRTNIFDTFTELNKSHFHCSTKHEGCNHLVTYWNSSFTSKVEADLTIELNYNHQLSHWSRAMPKHFFLPDFFSWREHSRTTKCEHRIRPPDKLFKLLRRAKINRLIAIHACRIFRIIKSTSKGELTWYLRIWFSSTKIPIQWSLALRIALTLFFEILVENEIQIGKRTRYQTYRSRRLIAAAKEVNQFGLVTSPVVALPSYPWSRSTKKCTGRNVCKMWSAYRLE